MTPINASSVAIAERYARELFGLSLPLSAGELKSAFRAAAKRLHTDTSGDQATKDQFVAMKNAYDFLVKLEGMEYVYGTRTHTGSLTTTDGTPLYELGLGLGPMKNGRDCERCNHKGYTEEHDVLDRTCWRCDHRGQVPVVELCGCCHGTGKFTQRRSGRVVPCRACLGRGRKSSFKLCPDCHGSKRIGGGRAHYSRCFKCGGTGEIELFSPLLPKGRLINKIPLR